ncbi:hypothetical protein JI664_01025 [Rhodobacter sp. NTK016B]|uniref:hypothetical protein n=1 Tax=Rhodobacter sp. NTK016B TaxID=2759676 RepID=UPI001A8D416C|nr:hypothetical protein [Rhodobacter sp. NTK016B]MBN8290536.1 hypothetical protein [Rhodobacter sp. NTK016B]
MPLTDITELMDRVETLLEAAPLDPEAGVPFQTAPKSESLIADPMPELNAPLRSFAQVYGANGRLLEQLGRDAAAMDEPQMASLLSALDRGLRDGAFVVPDTPKPAPRLKRYVYPVV